MNKKISYLSFVTFTLALLGLVNSLSAQSPAAIPYQAVARGASGNLIANQNISLRFSIHDGTAGGTVVYQETKSTTTNALGLFNVNIGQGTVVTGTFAGINWAAGAKFTQVEIDVTGGTSYVDIGTQQMMSVPYALYAASSGTTGSNQWTTNGNDINNSNTGNVGIGTTTPEFKLSLDNDGGILAKGTFGSGANLTTNGAGTRMIWYPNKAAFRAGTAFGTEWDDANIGYQSTAFGFGTKASGNYSTALGYGTLASGQYSIALGGSTNASGYTSAAFGAYTTASGYGSIAMGDGTTASGDQSAALGKSSIASGAQSIATGFSTTASGNQSTAMGYGTTASGNGSVAIGIGATASGYGSTALGNHVNTNSKIGAFSIGDKSTTTPMQSLTDHEFSARFDGGYRLFSDAATTTANGLFFTGGKQGIGTPTPEFKLSLDNDGGILAKGIVGAGATLATAGVGQRMFWYPKKAAFRAGSVDGTEWDDANIGNYSIALGNSTLASANYSTAFGDHTTASGIGSTAMGYQATASGQVSTAIGDLTIASGSFSTAMGYQTTSSAQYSTALGKQTTASGDRSTALGNLTTASALSSTAMGDNTTASGSNSTAIGLFTTASGYSSTAMGTYASTNLKLGAFALGDNSTTTLMNSSVDNEFSARFAGGYRLFSNASMSTGVTLAAGGGSWTSISDRNKKENFTQINVEDILQKVGALPLSNWNYKTQPVAQRHIGPMAQDFFAAFHLDGESDTTINSLDIDGVNMAAIQALKVRTDELKLAVEELKNQKQMNASMRNELDALKAALEKSGVIEKEVSASANSMK